MIVITRAMYEKSIAEHGRNSVKVFNNSDVENFAFSVKSFNSFNVENSATSWKNFNRSSKISTNSTNSNLPLEVLTANSEFSNSIDFRLIVGIPPLCQIPPIQCVYPLCVTGVYSSVFAPSTTPYHLLQFRVEYTEIPSISVGFSFGVRFRKLIALGFYG